MPNGVERGFLPIFSHTNNRYLIPNRGTRITYPVGVHFYHEGKIVEALRSINGIKAPALVEY